MNLAHRLDGPEDAPVLVLSSSLGTTHELWDGQVPELARAFRVLRYDHRGHGGSDVPPGPYTVAQLAADVLGLLDRLGLGRVSFCGLSLGGAVGMWLASRAPERIERLALCCTSARFGTTELWTERARTVRAEGVEAVADATMGRWFTERFRDERPDVVARFRAMLCETAPEGYAACCEALGAWDFRQELGSIAAPTLVVAGADDPAAPPEQAELIAAGIPGARLVVLPDAAHLANVEQPQGFRAALLAHVLAEVV